MSKDLHAEIERLNRLCEASLESSIDWQDEVWGLWILLQRVDNWVTELGNYADPGHVPVNVFQTVRAKLTQLELTYPDNVEFIKETAAQEDKLLNKAAANGL